jgi:hypothetical protein
MFFVDSVNVISTQLEGFLGALLRRAVELKQEQAASAGPAGDRGSSVNQSTLDVSDFDFLGVTEEYPSTSFLSAAVAEGLSSCAHHRVPDAQKEDGVPIKLSSTPWVWNGNVPIRGQLEALKRFFPIQRKLSERALKRKEGDKERSRMRTEKAKQDREARLAQKSAQQAAKAAQQASMQAHDDDSS